MNPIGKRRRFDTTHYTNNPEPISFQEVPNVQKKLSADAIPPPSPLSFDLLRAKRLSNYRRTH